jgi:hypothetical protein
MIHTVTQNYRLPERIDVNKTRCRRTESQFQQQERWQRQNGPLIYAVVVAIGRPRYRRDSTHRMLNRLPPLRLSRRSTYSHQILLQSDGQSPVRLLPVGRTCDVVTRTFGRQLLQSRVLSIRYPLIETNFMSYSRPVCLYIRLSSSISQGSVTSFQLVNRVSACKGPL